MTVQSLARITRPQAFTMTSLPAGQRRFLALAIRRRMFRHPVIGYRRGFSGIEDDTDVLCFSKIC